VGLAQLASRMVTLCWVELRKIRHDRTELDHRVGALPLDPAGASDGGSQRGGRWYRRGRHVVLTGL